MAPRFAKHACFKMTAPTQNHAVTAAPLRRPTGVAIFGLYLAIALIVFARGLPGQFANDYVGYQTDPPQTMWFFNWWRFAIVHRLNPFITHWVWAPRGVNLTWTTFIPLPALLSIPLQVTVGEPTTYNIIVLLMPPLAAFCAFPAMPARDGSTVAVILGGYIFGFSPYMLGEMLGHLDLAAVFIVPLVALVTLKKFDGEISARWFCDPVCRTDDGSVSFFPGIVRDHHAGWWIFSPARSRSFRWRCSNGTPASRRSHCRRIRDFDGPTLAVLLLHARLRASERVDLAAEQFFRGSDRIRHTAANYLVGLHEFCHRHLPPLRRLHSRKRRLPRRRLDRLRRGLSASLLADIGRQVPHNIVYHDNHRGHGLDSAHRRPRGIQDAVGHLPAPAAHREILPVRFMMYAFLVIAIMAAMWLASSPARTLTKCAAAAAILISIAPNPHASFWVSPLDLPAFFADRTYATELAPGDIIFPLPWAQKGNSMYWQLASDMYFRMAGGWTGYAPFEFTRMPVANYFYGGIDLPESGEQLKAYLARFGARRLSRIRTRKTLRASRRRSMHSASREFTKRECGFIKFRAIRWLPMQPCPGAARSARQRVALRRDPRGRGKISRRQTRSVEALAA